MNWNDQIQTQKGNLGEDIIDKYLKSIGLIPYFPQVDGAHPFDRLCATKNKKYLCIVDSKAKARRSFYPDTGINLKTFNEYLYMQEKYNIDVWIFFVDEDMKSIYGNKLHDLMQPHQIYWKRKELLYPLRQRNGKGTEEIYFPLSAMKNIHELTEPEVQELKEFSSRNYQYFTEVGANA